MKQLSVYQGVWCLAEANPASHPGFHIRVGWNMPQPSGLQPMAALGPPGQNRSAPIPDPENLLLYGRVLYHGLSTGLINWDPIAELPILKVSVMPGFRESLGPALKDPLFSDLPKDAGPAEISACLIELGWEPVGGGPLEAYVGIDELTLQDETQAGE